MITKCTPDRMAWLVTAEDIDEERMLECVSIADVGMAAFIEEIEEELAKAGQ